MSHCTEDEAKQRECRVAGPLEGGDLTMGLPMFANCAAKECMHWRWFDSVTEAASRCAIAERLGACNPTTDQELRDRGKPYRRGFCGLAGKPNA